MTGFAILAPVPLEHLDAGQDIVAKEDFVAFGSRKFELFWAIDKRRNGEPASVLIFPSHEDDPVGSSFKVSWIGWYVGKEETHNGCHSSGMKHRPPTTPARTLSTTQATGRFFGMSSSSSSWQRVSVFQSPNFGLSRADGEKMCRLADLNWLPYPNSSNYRSRPWLRPKTRN